MEEMEYSAIVLFFLHIVSQLFRVKHLIVACRTLEDVVDGLQQFPIRHLCVGLPRFNDERRLVRFILNPQGTRLHQLQHQG